MRNPVARPPHATEDIEYVIEAPIDGVQGLWQNIMAAVADPDRRTTFDIDIRRGGRPYRFQVTPGEVDYRDPNREGVHHLEDAEAKLLTDDAMSTNIVVKVRLITVGSVEVRHGMPIGTFKMTSRQSDARQSRPRRAA